MSRQNGDKETKRVDDSMQLFDLRHFQNGRLDLKFNSEDDARRVAEVLINGFTKSKK